MERAPVDLSFMDAFRVLFRIRTAWVMVVAAGVSDFFFVGLGAWSTSFFRRHHGLDEASASVTMSVVLVAVIAGAVLGGRHSDRLLAQGRARSRIGFAAVCYVAGGAAACGAFAAGPLALAVVLLLVGGFLIYLPIPALWAMWIDIVPPTMRGRAGSVSSILRAGFAAAGPPLIGALSDVWDLRTAFVLVTPTLAGSGLIILLARPTYERDAAAARRAATELLDA
jgi:MFS family permease